MQSDLETLIVLLIFAAVIWAQWKMVKHIRFADRELTEFVLRGSGGLETAGSGGCEQTETGSAGWDSLLDCFEFV